MALWGSVHWLFVAAGSSGLLMMVVLMMAVRSQQKRLYTGKSRTSEPSEIGKAAIESIWALIFPVILIVGIRSVYLRRLNQVHSLWFYASL